MNGKIKNNKSRSSKRPIDQLSSGVYSWLGKSFILISRTKVKTWQGLLIIAFVAGALSALIWSVAVHVQTASKAVGETATLSLSPATKSVERDGTFDVKALMNTNGSNVVAVKSVINYDKNSFTLMSWNTANSVFSINNSCVYNGKPCEIITNDPANGKITITEAKPAPGVSSSSGELATLTFKAIKEVTPSADNIAINFTSAGNYSDSDVMLARAGSSSNDILSGVSNARVTVSAPPAAGVYGIKMITPGMTIDGNCAEYAKANPVTITNKSTGTTGTYRLLWSSNYLYGCAQVFDKTLEAVTTAEDGAVYADDSWQLYFDTNNNGGSTRDSSDYGFAFNIRNAIWTQRGDADVAWDVSPEFKAVYSGSLNKSSDTDTSYNVEFRIPFSGWVTVPTGDATIWRMELNQNDRSGGARNQTQWANTNGGDKIDPAGWGVLKFLSTSN